MKKSNILRILIYLLLIAVSILYIQMEKNNVIESREKKAITLIGEQLEHGIPVDLQEIRLKKIPIVMRVTVTEVDQKSHSLTFYYDNSQKPKLRKSQDVLSTNDHKKVGTVTSLSNRISAGLGLYKGKIKPSKEQEMEGLKLKSLDIVIAQSKNTLSVPQSAILYNKKGEPYVWVSEKGAAKKQVIKVGKNFSLEVEVLEGLKGGMKVVTNGGKTLEAGAQLRVRNCKDCEGVAKND